MPVIEVIIYFSFELYIENYEQRDPETRTNLTNGSSKAEKNYRFVA